MLDKSHQILEEFHSQYFEDLEVGMHDVYGPFQSVAPPRTSQVFPYNSRQGPKSGAKNVR